MKSKLFAIALLSVIPGMAVGETAAPDAGSISDKVMKDAPGTHGGTTADPTIKPEDSSLSTKAANDLPGSNGGSTADPTAKPADGLSSKIKKDLADTK